MRLRSALLAATMLALPLAAEAQPVTGLYVAGAAGANWHGNETVEIGANQNTFPMSLPVRTNTGWVMLGSLGWGFGNGLRAEAEVSYRSNRVDGLGWVIHSPRQGSFAAQYDTRSGAIATTGAMVNLFYDIGAAQGWPVQITLGGGIGYGWHRWNNVGFAAPGSQSLYLDGTRAAFAYQGIAGLTIPIRAVPGLSVTAEYRYFATQAVTMNASYSVLPGIINARLPTSSVGNSNQSVLVGVRYNFGRAPAAPPPAAAPAPASSFIVFFDFNRDDLTARAREIVAQAAAAARSQQVTRIEVAGHTDTVGSAQYNLGLSQRRANTVAAELVRLGVPRQAISTAGYGFSRPLVATGPNVREPQNRRVEIVFR